MKILTDENGNKYEVKHEFHSCLKPQYMIEKIEEKKTFSWEDVADGVLVCQGLSSRCHFLFDSQDNIAKDSLRFSDKWQYWGGGEYPLPEGVMVEVEFRDGFVKTLEAVSLCWGRFESTSSQDIIAFRVIGLAEGYIYPDELEGE